MPRYYHRLYRNNGAALVERIPHCGKSPIGRPVSGSDGDRRDDHHLSRDILNTSPTTSPTQPDISVSSHSPLVPCTAAANKPLHSSLKSCNASPRLYIDPCTPPGSDNIARQPFLPKQPHKNVHFQDDARLAAVRLFRITGKPKSISRREDETETETDTCDEHFPSHLVSPPRFFIAPPPLSSQVPLSPPQLCSGSPSYFTTHPVAPHILLSSLDLTDEGDDPPCLFGCIFVRNIAYEKKVTVRFTLDNWRTTSETAAKYSSPGVLPPQWRADDFPYDAFRFKIALHSLPRCTLFLAAQLLADGGEWWDNNSGENYTVTICPPPLPCRSQHSLPSQNRPSYANSAANSVSNTGIGAISRGTGFSFLALPVAPPPPATEHHPPRLTLRNHARAKPWGSHACTLEPEPAPKTRTSVSAVKPASPVRPQFSMIGRDAANVAVGHEGVAVQKLVTVMRENAKQSTPSSPRLDSPRATSPVKAEADTAHFPVDAYPALLTRWCFTTSTPPQDECLRHPGPLDDQATRPTAVGFA